MTTMQRKKRIGKTMQRLRKVASKADLELKDRAQCWLRERFRLSGPTVIQSNGKGFYFMFPNESSTYFLKWSDMRSDSLPDLKAAKVH